MLSKTISRLLLSLLVFFISKTFSNESYLEEGEARGEPWFPEPTPTPPPGPSVAECNRNIYRRCNQPTQFSANDLNTVLTYLNTTYTTLADIKPDNSVQLCSAITVRRDWKCLTVAQRNRIVNDFQQLYTNGVIANLTDTYVRYWAAWHETGELFLAQRWLAYELESAMQQIDPGVILPYWCPWPAAAHPERSIVWDTFGHNGSYPGGYCVGDGVYNTWGLIPCVKRHWSPRGTIYPWASPELDTNLLHYGTLYELFYLAYIGIYYQPLINAGGYEGQFSKQDAPYDVLFYMKSLCETEVRGIKWQLSKQENLTPLSYNLLNTRFDPQTGAIQQADINTDTLTGVPDVSIKQLFWLGFGNLCVIPDSVVRPVVRASKGQADPLPRAIQRMQPWIVAKYYSGFQNGNTSNLLSTFEEVGDCNQQCLPLPKPTFLPETPAGRRLLADQGVNRGSLLSIAEQRYYSLWYDLNKSGYCSPYVTN
ncbi:uncharacterized protein LOC128961435 [Oppia nitens]|uniref:uncharacterized protein LOC128961435 n=1 Tax=Oppia nitens TaxID=1686743 RepID=UPI0023DC175F|nr:uncharacterized protein LOC128961435 [Oppia nitens]XP_054163651.1 uncharacterized protein LOC128961435 [Oppia nitens]